MATMWSRCLTLWACVGLLLVDMRADSASPNSHSLVSICRTFSMKWESVLDSSTIVYLPDTIDAAMQCSLIIKTFSSNKILISMAHNSQPTLQEQCAVKFVLSEPGKEIKVLQYPACILPLGSKVSSMWYTSGNQVNATFIMKKVPTTKLANISLLFTAITKDCQPGRHFKCGDWCMDSSMMCDGVKQCPSGEDELRCDGRSDPNRPASPTTPGPLVSTTPADLGDIYLWLPLIVVVVFTILMLALILAGRGAASRSGQRYRRAVNVAPSFGTESMDWSASSSTDLPTTTAAPGLDNANIDLITMILVAVVFLVILIGCVILGFREQRHRNQEERLNDNLRLETNTNSGFNEGGPPTPPPTYSYIERQTSYVSHISQTDSQISVPPSYEDAVDVEDDPMSWRRRLRRHLSRSTSVTSRPSRRQRHFQRSLSAQETPAPRFHTSSDPGTGRERHTSEQASSRHASSTSDSDSVFLEYPPSAAVGMGQELSPRGNLTAPSMLENVSEVDETLGSSLMLIGESTGDITANHVGQDAASQNHLSAEQGRPAQRRPVLARSISDVTSGNTDVIFAIE